MGHASCKHLSIVSKHELALGIPKLSRVSNVICGLTRTESLGGKRCILVVVDDFTRYTWVILLQSKFDASEHIEVLCTRLQNEKGLRIDRI